MINSRSWRTGRAGLAALVLLAVGARAWLLGSTPLVPGMNGAYYLVQVRSLVERGRLGVPDLPLAFAVQAALAWILHSGAGLGADAAILWAVKVEDAVLPTLVAVPVFVLGRKWAERAGLGPGVPLVAAALVVLGAPALSMVGDFQKNSLALVWLALLVGTLHALIEQPAWPRGIAAVVALGLLGMTHIGVFGGALLVGGATALAHLTLEGIRGLRQRWLFLAAALVCVALVGTVVFWRFDPKRALRLIGAFVHPAAFFAHTMPMPGGPGAPALLRFAPAVIGVVLSGAALARAARVGTLADRATLVGCAAGVLGLTGPWVRADIAMRFYLIALVPAVLLLGFALVGASRRVRSFVLALVCLATVGPAVPLVAHGGHAIISDTAYDDLVALRGLVPPSEKTLVVADHGAEWWTAWVLRTHIAQAPAVREEDWAHFDAVYFLDVKEGLAMPGPGPRRGPGRDGGPPRGFPPPPPPPMMAGAAIPSTADIVYDGPALRLARVLTPPEFVARQGAR